MPHMIVYEIFELTITVPRKQEFKTNSVNSLNDMGMIWKM